MSQKSWFSTIGSAKVENMDIIDIVNNCIGEQLTIEIL